MGDTQTTTGIRLRVEKTIYAGDMVMYNELTGMACPSDGQHPTIFKSSEYARAGTTIRVIHPTPELRRKVHDFWMARARQNAITIKQLRAALAQLPEDGVVMLAGVQLEGVNAREVYFNAIDRELIFDTGEAHYEEMDNGLWKPLIAR